ncbi:MAG TPA: hypothetical protein DDY68_03530, partial [Porphyromonadaceae bacterium]|nr:hypothetical protein [Porphyromonadaceae bacterium]
MISMESVNKFFKGSVVAFLIFNAILPTFSAGNASTSVKDKVDSAYISQSTLNYIRQQMKDIDDVLSSLTKANLCGEGLSYMIDANGVCTITGNGKAIDKEAFKDNISIKEVRIPSSVKSIGKGAFAECRKLKTINLQEVSSIEEGAFFGCKALENLNLSEVVSIGTSAFFGCKNLKMVKAPNLVIIGESAFEECTCLLSIEMPSIEEIKRKAFFLCSDLRRVSIKGVDIVEADAFSESALEVVYLGKKVPY